MPEPIIDIAFRAPRPHPYQKRAMHALLAATLRELLPASEVEVSVSLVGDRRQRQLNREHRGKDKTTDVLSFPLEHDLRPVILRHSAAPAYLAIGDIVISPKVALAQADDWGWTPAERMTQLLIHGLLHLLGFDHEEETERLAMEAEEERLFALLESQGLISPLASE